MQDHKIWCDDMQDDQHHSRGADYFKLMVHVARHIIRLPIVSKHFPKQTGPRKLTIDSWIIYFPTE
jgi:hypothetical protein